MLRTNKRTVVGLLALAFLLGAMASGALERGLHPVAVGDQGDKGKDPRAADRAAIRKTRESFLKAFAKGDARAVASHWTAEGEYIAEDGTTLRGRNALEHA